MTAWQGFTMLVVLACVFNILVYALLQFSRTFDWAADASDTLPAPDRAELRQQEAPWRKRNRVRLVIVTLNWIALIIIVSVLSKQSADRRIDSAISRLIQSEITDGKLLKVADRTAYVQLDAHGCIVRRKTEFVDGAFRAPITNHDAVVPDDQAAAGLEMFSSVAGDIYCFKVRS